MNLSRSVDRAPAAQQATGIAYPQGNLGSEGQDMGQFSLFFYYNYNNKLDN